MATVTDILAIASKLANLRAGVESDVSLATLNTTYLRACLDTECTGTDVTYTATSSAEKLNASAIAGTAVMRVQHLSLVSAGQRIPLQQVSRAELQDHRAIDEAQGVPQMYAVSLVAGEPAVDFWPNISSGDQVRMSYLAHPGTLEATSSVAYIPEMFHHDILTNALVGALLERDGKADKAQLWNAKSLEAITRLEEYLGQMGGIANRAYVSPSVSRGQYPDRHIR